MSDYNFLMESRFSPEQFQVVNQLSRVASAQGLNLYLVGGAVRDLTYGQQRVRDLDFAVEGNIEKILRALEAGQSKKRRGGPGAEGAQLEIEQLHVDARRNSADVVFAPGIRAEIAMARTESYTRYGHRPEIAAAAIFDDLKRRDFSVNAMAVSLHPNSRGLLLDPTNGVADIERRELRALNSRSFMEEPSRIYRLIRLALRLDFKTEERTQLWLDRALEARATESVDSEQQGRELRAILEEEHPSRVLKALAERRLLAGLDRKLGQVRISYDRFDRVRSVARSIPGADTFPLNFRCLVEKLSPAEKARFAKKIIGDAKTIKSILGLDREANKLARLLTSSRASLPSEVYGILSGRPEPLLLLLLADYPHAKLQSRVKSFVVKTPQVRAQLPRAELQSLGVEPGPKFERILHQVLLQQLDGKLKTHQQINKALRELAGIKEHPPGPAETRTTDKKKVPTEHAKQGPAKPKPTKGKPARQNAPKHRKSR